MENKKPNENLLAIRDLVVEYTSDKQVVHAVNSVSLDIARGETLGLVGETGAGKTTIAKSILRILPDRSANLKSGQITYEGHNLLELNYDEMQKIRGDKISMVFQDPMTALNPVKTVGNQVAGVIALHNDIGKEDAWSRAQEMLAMVGITEDRMKEFPHQFSGGMKQRVIIAMALACNPDLLLADEPTTALDVTIQAQVLEMIKELKHVKNTAMLLITHDLGIVAENCDKVAIIYAGEIVEFGTVEDIFDHPSHPYTIGLFGAIPDIESDEEWLHPIEGTPPDPSNLPPGCSFSPRCPYATDRCFQEGPVSMQPLGGIHTCRCLNIDRSAERER